MEVLQRKEGEDLLQKDVVTSVINDYLDYMKTEVAGYMVVGQEVVQSSQLSV